MSDWRYVYRCRDCKHIYEKDYPLICVKCGKKLQTINIDQIIARPEWFGWEVKGETKVRKYNHKKNFISIIFLFFICFTIDLIGIKFYSLRYWCIILLIASAYCLGVWRVSK